jgi:hypothetical protein
MFGLPVDWQDSSPCGLCSISCFPVFFTGALCNTVVVIDALKGLH